MITCRLLADMVGVPYNTEQILPEGKIRYCRTDAVSRNIEPLSKGGNCVLVTSSSDMSVTKNLVDLLPSNVTHWFSTNVMYNDSRLIAIPIGFVNNAERMQHLLAQKRMPKPATKNLLYINFTRKTNKLRLGLYERFAGYTWATLAGGESAYSVAPADFYADIASHKYTLSPPGAGPDCHRTWEALALGSIPIVLRSFATEILNDLPVLQVSSWTEIRQGVLVREYSRLVKRFKNLEKLQFNYWKERILSCVS